MNLKQLITTNLDNINRTKLQKPIVIMPLENDGRIIAYNTLDRGIVVALIANGKRIVSKTLYTWKETPARISMASSRTKAEAEKVADFEQVYLDWIIKFDFDLLISLDCYLKQVHAAMLERGDCFADSRNEQFSHCLPALRAELNKLNEETGVKRRLFNTAPKNVAFTLSGEVLGCSFDSGKFEERYGGKR